MSKVSISSGGPETYPPVYGGAFAQRNPLLYVRGVILNSNGELLMGKRSTVSGKQGKIELLGRMKGPKETLTGTLIQEVLKESGIVIKPVLQEVYVGGLHPRSTGNNLYGGQPLLLYACYAEVEDDASPVPGTGHDTVAWLDMGTVIASLVGRVPHYRSDTLPTLRAVAQEVPEFASRLTRFDRRHLGA